MRPQLLIQAWLTASIWACCGLAAAEPMADPTRPPAAFMPRATAQQGVMDGVAGGLQLQSILISPGRKIAIINGEAVALHGRIGDATLVRIGEAHVTLRTGKTELTLPLFPDMQMQPAAGAVGHATQ